MKYLFYNIESEQTVQVKIKKYTSFHWYNINDLFLL
jgi:hypothetical protein